MAWPGLDTRGGRLDDGTGQLEDGSVNCQINRRDILSKRSGFVRGLDEWFGTPVCGLFTYLDYCGNEYLLVAEQDGINIRQPFVLPQFLASDAYPNDNFDGAGAINVTNWRNQLRYVRASDRMVQDPAAALFTGPRMPDDLFMRWFKAAGSLAYRVIVDYVFDPLLLFDQRASAIIRGNGDLSAGALLQVDIVFNPNGLNQVQLFHRENDGTSYRTLLTDDLDGITTTPRGTLTFSYERDAATSSFIPIVSVLPNLGTFRTLRADTLTTLQDIDLGLVSALGLGQKGGAVSQSIGVEIVTGGPI
ncbi:MAG TPA: hypothetical protein ENG98_00415 [Actinobacteria bacterium]|nr:hypothetical protein [Actinomycetota bacterium]